LAICQRLGFVLEGGHGQHRAEDLFLEDAHLVVALEQRRLDVVAAGQVAAELGALAADQHLRAFLLADVEVGQDLVHLLAARPARPSWCRCPAGCPA
jgi:electron transfer flavoprotein alpha subunit